MQDLLESLGIILSQADANAFNIDLSLRQWIQSNENKISSLPCSDFAQFIEYISGILFSKTLPYSCDELAGMLQRLLYSEQISYSSTLVILIEKLHEYAQHVAIDFAEKGILPESVLASESVLAITMPKSAGSFISVALKKKGINNYTGHLIGQSSYNRLSRPRMNIMSALGLQVTHSHVCPSFFNAYAIRASSIPKIWIHLRSRLDHILASLVRMAQFESHLFVNGDAKMFLDGIRSRRLLDNDPCVMPFLNYYRSFYRFWHSFASKTYNNKEILLTSFDDFKSNPVEALNLIGNFYGASRFTVSEYHQLTRDSSDESRYNVNKHATVGINDLFSDAFLDKLSTLN